MAVVRAAHAELALSGPVKRCFFPGPLSWHCTTTAKQHSSQMSVDGLRSTTLRKSMLKRTVKQITGFNLTRGTQTFSGFCFQSYVGLWRPSQAPRPLDGCGNADVSASMHNMRRLTALDARLAAAKITWWPQRFVYCVNQLADKHPNTSQPPSVSPSSSPCGSLSNPFRPSQTAQT